MTISYLSGGRIQGVSNAGVYNEPDAGNENATNIANYAGGKTHRGQIFTTGHAMIGQKPQKVVVSLKKQGSPTGTMRVVIVKDSDKSQIDIGTKDISTLTTSMVSYTFENTSQSYALVSGDGVFLEFSDTSGTNDSGQDLRPWVGYQSAGTYTQYAWKLYTGGVWEYGGEGGGVNQPMVISGESDKATLLNNGTPTTTVDFSSDPLTSSSTEVSYNATTDKIEYSLDGSQNDSDRGTIDLGGSVGASWVIDFDINDTAVTSSSSARLCNFFGMATNNVDLTSTTALGGTLGVSSDIDTDSPRDRYEIIASSTGDYQSTDYITDADTIADNDHWYVRMTKDGSADTFKVDFYTASARTGSPAHTVTISGVTFDDVRYFGIWDSADTGGGGSQRQVGNMSEIKFYNNTTTIPTMTPLQTQFEETDTRKQYSLLYTTSGGSIGWVEMGTGGFLS